MELTDKRIEEFATLYLGRFNKEINKTEAYEQGLKLMHLIRTIYKPLPQEYHQ